MAGEAGVVVKRGEVVGEGGGDHAEVSVGVEEGGGGEVEEGWEERRGRGSELVAVERGGEEGAAELEHDDAEVVRAFGEASRWG